jgi:hypothetical protein
MGQSRIVSKNEGGWESVNNNNYNFNFQCDNPFIQIDLVFI